MALFAHYAIITADMRFTLALCATLALAACDNATAPPPEVAPTPTPVPRPTPFTGFKPPQSPTNSGSWMWDKNRANNPLGSPPGKDKTSR